MKDLPNIGIEYTFLSDSKEGQNWMEHCYRPFCDEGWVRLGNTRAVYPTNFVRYYDRMKSFVSHPQDIWVSSFPKSGTTWTQEMVYCVATNGNLELAKVNLQKRFPYFELQANWSPNVTTMLNESGVFDATAGGNQINTLDLLDKMGGQRFIKTHLHYSLLPISMQNENSPKLVHVARNPRDVIVSYYHHSCLWNGYTGTLDDFVDAFISEAIFSTPYWTHIKEYWELRDRRNILFIKYEDMKKDLPSVIRKTASFLGNELSDEQVTRLANHLSFESMRENTSVNYKDHVTKMQKVHGESHNTNFIRKGEVGLWRDEVSVETAEKLDDWLQKYKIVGLFDD